MRRSPLVRSRPLPRSALLPRLRPLAAAALALAAIACSRAPPLMADAAALTQAQQALAALPEFAGRAPQVHSAALFHDDDVEIAVVDPGDDALLHLYRYQQRRWQREESMQHTCVTLRRSPQQRSDDLALDRIDFATAARVRANWYQRASGVPGALADPEYDRLSGVWFYTRDHSRIVERGRDGPKGGKPDGAAPSPDEHDAEDRGEWATGPISGQDGIGYEIKFAADGSVRRFERLR